MVLDTTRGLGLGIVMPPRVLMVFGNMSYSILDVPFFILRLGLEEHVMSGPLFPDYEAFGFVLHRILK